MDSYEITLVLDRDGYLADAEVHALFEATGGEANVEHGPGGVHVTVEREAETLTRAITTAMRDIETVPGLRVAGVAHEDGVTLADIARRAGRTRESIRLYATGRRGPGGFPAPDWVSSAGDKFWSWAEVGSWLADHVGVTVELTQHELVAADRMLAARAALRDEDEADRAELVGLLT